MGGNGMGREGGVETLVAVSHSTTLWQDRMKTTK